MQGKRVDERPSEEGQYPFPRLQPGEYGKGRDRVWYCVPPDWDNARPGNLGAHSITEHEDGTITAPATDEAFMREHFKEWKRLLKANLNLAIQREP